jgi:IMP dehydrogenase
LVGEVMTKMPLVTGRVGISGNDAMALLAANKIEKLPLVDEHDRLRGLITLKDFVKSDQYPDASKDDQGRLRVGRPSASSATPGSGRWRWSRRASTCWWSTPRTALPGRAGDGGPAQGRVGCGACDIIGGTSRRTREPRPSSTRARTGSRSVVGPGSICTTGWWPASACPR